MSDRPAEARQALTTGSEVDGLVIGEPLHSGAMGRIYRATPAAGRPAPGFPLILKVPRSSPGDGGSGLLGFQTEALALRAIASPYVPRMVGGGDIAAAPYLALEWIEGRSLEAVLRKGRLPRGDVSRIGAAIADALHSIHRQDVIHLDLKPENVIVRPSGQVALIDFGMAHHARYPDLLAEEKRYASGSAPYVSPEQILGNRADPRSDLFALGVMLYEMATGELPFGAPQSLAGLRDRLWIDPVPPIARIADLPAWLQEVTLRCLEPDAEQRYQSAAHIAFDLRHPEQIALTARAQKRERAGVIEQARRWWAARSHRPPGRAASRGDSAPVVMVAVDTTHPDDERHPELRAATARILRLSSEYRLIFVSIVRGEPLASGVNETGIHLEHLVRLRKWAGPLGVPDDRLSLHVIESLGPSGALLEFARSNNVDLIVIGAPGPGREALAWWRSVASAVTANAHCSVLVVRVREPV